jgi:hypothetical protein
VKENAEMDEDERDYDQHTFFRALRELIDDPRAHDIDVRVALTTQLAMCVAADDEQDFAVERKFVLWAIEGLLIAIDPSPWRHKCETIDVIMAKIDKAIWQSTIATALRAPHPGPID